MDSPAGCPYNRTQRGSPILPPANHRNRVLLDLRAAAPRVGHHQQHAGPVAGVQHPVHLAERGGERLLDVDVGAGGGRRQHHLQVATHFMGGDHRDVRLLGGQHLAVVGVGGGGAGQLGMPPPARRVGVGQGDDFRPLHAHERLVEPVPVVSLTGVADDHNAFAHRGSLWHTASCTVYRGDSRPTRGVRLSHHVVAGCRMSVHGARVCAIVSTWLC